MDFQALEEEMNTNGSQSGISVCSSRPVSSLASRLSCASYAEATAKGLEDDRSSKVRKGVKQRQKRQRRREGRGAPSAPTDRLTGRNSSA